MWLSFPPETHKQAASESGWYKGLAEHLQGENTAFGVLGSQLLTANFLPIAANGSYNENWVTMCKNSCNRKTLWIKADLKFTVVVHKWQKSRFWYFLCFTFFVIHERSLHWNCLKLRLKRRTWPAVVDGGIKSSPAGWGIDCKAVLFLFFCFFKPSVIIINYTLYYFTGKAWVTLLWHVNAGPFFQLPPQIQCTCVG